MSWTLMDYFLETRWEPFLSFVMGNHSGSESVGMTFRSSYFAYYRNQSLLVINSAVTWHPLVFVLVA